MAFLSDNLSDLMVKKHGVPWKQISSIVAS